MVGLALIFSTFVYSAAFAQPAPALPLPADARFDPVLTRMFTPADVPAGVYRVYVSTRRLADALSPFKAAAGAAPPGSWQAQQLEPVTAFGAIGHYDQTKLGRLFDGARVTVARGPLARDGRVVASVTLISPYPNHELTKVVGGTMVVVFEIGKSGNLEIGKWN